MKKLKTDSTQRMSANIRFRIFFLPVRRSKTRIHIITILPQRKIPEDLKFMVYFTFKICVLPLVSNSAVKYTDTDKDNNNVPDEELVLIPSMNKKMIILSLLNNL